MDHVLPDVQVIILIMIAFVVIVYTIIITALLLRSLAETKRLSTELDGQEQAIIMQTRLWAFCADNAGDDNVMLWVAHNHSLRRFLDTEVDPFTQIDGKYRLKFLKWCVYRGMQV